MSRDQDPFDAKVLEILEVVFDAEERGESADIEELCSGDEALLRKVTEVLGRPKRVFGSPGIGPAKKSSGGIAFKEIGEQVGPWKISGHIGRGAMGSVYEAVSVATGETVALKVIAVDPSDDVRVFRFEREAEIMTRLKHPNIVPVISFDRSGQEAWIAMKRLTGPSLDHLEKRPTIRDTANWGALIAHALDFAHEAGVVHRDIKPSNIILDRGIPMIADFGLARGLADTTLTREGATPGTLPYMPPEILRGESGLDFRTDIYALGATLYEIVAGHRAFFAPDEAVMIGMILMRDPPPLSLLAEDRDFETIVLRAMAKEPHRRFPRASAFAQDLERFSAGKAILSKRPGILDTLLRGIRRRPKTSAALALAFVVVATAGGWVAIERRDREAAARTTLATFDGFLEDRRLVTARRILDDMADLGIEPGEAREARRRYDAVVAFESLIDQVLDRAECQNNLILDKLIRRVEAFPESLHHRNVQLAVAIAEIYRRNNAHAEKRIASLEPGVAVTAIRAAIAQKLPDDAAVSGSADELVLASCAIRFLPNSLALRQRWVDRALSESPGHYRAQFSHILLSATAGDARSGIDAAITIERPDRPHPGLARLRAWICVSLGRWNQGLSELARVPEEYRSPFDDIINYKVLCGNATIERQLEFAKVARERWPGDVNINLMVAECAVRAGDALLLQEALDETKDESLFPVTVPSVRAARLNFRLASTTNFSSRSQRITAAEEERLQTIAREAEAEATSVDNPDVKSQFLWMASQANRFLGKIDRSLELAETASVNSANSAARIGFVSWVGLETKLVKDDSGQFNFDDPLNARESRFGRAALEVVREFVPNNERLAVRASTTENSILALFGAVVARRHGEKALAKRCVEHIVNLKKLGEKFDPRIEGKMAMLYQILEWSADP